MITTSSNPATATKATTLSSVTTSAGLVTPVTATTATAAMLATAVTSDTAMSVIPTTAAAPSMDTLLSGGKDTGSGSERLLGYIRVSTREQNEARQVDALQAFGVDKLYMDKQSGKDFARPAYCQLLAELQPGDTLVVKSIWMACCSPVVKPNVSCWQELCIKMELYLF